MGIVGLYPNISQFLGVEIYVVYSRLGRLNKMEKLTFGKLLKEARFLKGLGIPRDVRYFELKHLIRLARYYFVEQG